MKVKNMIVTGILKILHSLNVTEVVTQQLNGLSEEELNSLSGVLDNVQTQINTIQQKITEGEEQADLFRTTISNSVNTLVDSEILNKDSSLETFSDTIENSLSIVMKDLDASEGDLLEGKTAYSSNGLIVGIMPKNNAVQTSNVELSIVGDGYLYYRTPYGYYPINTATTNKSSIGAPLSSVASKVGLTAAKLLSGQSACGISGTATSDATASAAYILNGYTAYVNGSKITGSMPNISTPDYIDNVRLGYSHLYIGMSYGAHLVNDSVLGYPAVSPSYSHVASVIGLTASKLMVGNTILGIAGTATSDATATADNMVSGYTAYVNGSKITGNIPDYGREPTASGIGSYNGDLYMYIPGGPGENRGVIQRGIHIPFSNLGNVSAGSVLSGYTFTSAAGLNVTGSMANIGAYDYTEYAAFDGASQFYIGMTAGAHLNLGGSGYPEVRINTSKFGNAPASAVLSGYTFSSTAGLNVAGTAASYSSGWNDGYNSGVSAADNRANSGSVNYQSGASNAINEYVACLNSYNSFMSSNSSFKGTVIHCNVGYETKFQTIFGSWTGSMKNISYEPSTISYAGYTWYGSYLGNYAIVQWGGSLGSGGLKAVSTGLAVVGCTASLGGTYTTYVILFAVY